MKIRDLNIEEFTHFQKNHYLSNYFQTVNYAMLKAENDYEYELIGLVDEEENIKAASLILIKQIGKRLFYGYAPRGFLIDYQDDELVKTFTDLLKKHYYKKNVIFIKINPNVIVNEYDNETLVEKNNSNSKIKDILIKNGYKKLKDNLYFESQLPRFNAIIDLKEFKSNKLEKNTKNKIKKGIRKGLVLKKYDKSYLNVFYDMIKNKKDKDIFYYQDYYTVFNRDDKIDLFLVSIDYKVFLENSDYLYNQELEKNNKLNQKLAINNKDHIINAKMNSDKNLLSYKNDIMEATKGISDNKEQFLAGALVIRHNNTASILFSGYNTNYKRYSANYFLHYNLIKYYKDNFDYLDLNGIVGDFKNDNPYSGLNRFKLGFRPSIYEYIGEYDLVINKKYYDLLLHTGVLSKEFSKEK